MELLFKALAMISFALLVGGSFTENLVIQRMRRDGWQRRRGWRAYFTPTKEIIQAHQAVNGHSGWSRAYRIANASIFAGMAGVLSWVITACIWISH